MTTQQETRYKMQQGCGRTAKHFKVHRAVFRTQPKAALNERGVQLLCNLFQDCLLVSLDPFHEK